MAVTEQAAVREQWIREVTEVCNQIQTWSEARQWKVHRDQKILEESKYGRYMVPCLFVETPDGRLHIDPVGRDIVAADGRIDLTEFPTYDRMTLIRRRRKWHLETDNGKRWRDRWGERSFLKAVAALLQGEEDQGSGR